jgi:hypothetical protein
VCSAVEQYRSGHSDTLLGMNGPVRCVIVLAAFAAVMFGEDINVPLERGSIIIVDPHFITENDGRFTPDLTFTIVNRTSGPWNTLKLQFDMGGLCSGEPRQWSRTVVMPLGWMQEQPLKRQYRDLIIPLVGKVDGCHTEIIKASLVLAENPKVRFDGVTGERVDLEKQLREIEAKREAEASAKAERDRIAAEEQAKKDAEERARTAKARAAEKARLEKAQAEERATAAEERRKLRTACAEIYRNTANRKVSDLTVKEEQQVRACQGLGLYPPY